MYIHKDGALCHNALVRTGSYHSSLTITNVYLLMNKPCRVNFPGAVNSKFTTNLEFSNPSELPALPTYRFLDQDGVIVDKTRKPPDIADKEVLKMYKDMVTGM